MALKNLKVNLIQEMRKVFHEKNKRIAFTKILSKPSVKLALGERIIGAMVDRTLDGKDKFNTKFVGYSESYKKSLLFKIYKGAKKNPDLKLTGNMLASIDVVKLTPQGIEIGFPETLKNEREKAEGHVKGANYLPVRDFWGLPDSKTMEKIFTEVIRETQLFIEPIDTTQIFNQQIDVGEATILTSEVSFNEIES